MLPFLALFVVVEVDFVHGDGGDARRKGSAVDGRSRSGMAFHGEGVLVLTRDVEFLGNGFRGQPHAPVPFGVVFGHTYVGHNAPSSKGNGGHGFDASSDDAVGDARVNFGRGNGDRFKAAGAVAVDRHAGHFLRVEPHERHHASEVESLLGFRGGVADDDVVDAFFVELGEIRHQTTDHLFAQVVGPQKAETTSRGFGDGGSVSANDVCVHQFRRILPF